FEVTTRAEIVDPRGPVGVWIPLPLTPDTDYFKNLGKSWTGKAKSARMVLEEKYGAAMLVAEWEPGEAGPAVEVVTRFATRNLARGLSKAGARRAEHALV